ncbi:MAG: methyltransferase domain-containing protein [Chitinophagales bacterium]
MKIYNKVIHLKEEELEKAFKKCPFCDSEKSKTIGIVQESPLVKALVCKSCHLGYADRQPFQSILDEYYINYFDATRNTTIKKELLIKHLIAACSIVNQEYEVFNILDFGGGDGSIGYGLAQHILANNKIEKINIYVIDPNFIAIENNNAKISIYNSPSIEAIPSDEKANFVIASAILEHVKGPRKIITQLFDVMQPSAMFYARTPYIFPFKSLFKKVGINLSIQYPGHLFDMGNKFWSSILNTMKQENELQILVSRTSLVETSIEEGFFKWLVSHSFKMPSKFLNNHYHFVGGWEVVIMKNN